MTTTNPTSKSIPQSSVDGALSDDTGRQLRTGFAVVVLLVAGLGSWAANANLAGAVIASGTVVVDSNVKKVQHPTGGVVGEIRVREGDRVQEGDLVMRLDETITKANLGVIVAQLNELAVRQVRLKAERDGSELFDVPHQLKAREKDPDIAEIVSGERTHFESRRRSRAGQKAQLNERIAQLREEITGLEAQKAAKSKEFDLISTELSEVKKLWVKNLVPLSKFTSIRRDAARVEGERAQLLAAAAQAKGKITETELQIIQLENDTHTEVMKELREAQGKDSELQERRVAADDQLKRVDIRAPQTGIVHQLITHTVGGVINSSEPVMLIVPESDALVIETKIAPQDIDQVRVGQPALVRFTGFSQRTTPEFNGVVMRVAADLTKEAQTNQAYFVARVSVTEDSWKQHGDMKLLPGMPAEVYIRTTERTALSYLMKPLSDQIQKAFTER
jgi:HlyD family secretion protein